MVKPDLQLISFAERIITAANAHIVHLADAKTSADILRAETGEARKSSSSSTVFALPHWSMQQTCERKLSRSNTKTCGTAS